MLGWMRVLTRARQERRDKRPSAHLGLEALEERCVPTVGYVQNFLTADQTGAAANADPHLLNPAGIAFSTQGPFYLTDSAAGAATSYANDGTPGSATITIPPPSSNPLGASTPTGIVANPSSDFQITANGVTAPALLIFATADGTLSGWNPRVDPSHAVLELDDPTPATGPVYTGLALGTNASGNYLYAANFRAGTIDVYDRSFHKITLPNITTTASTTSGTTSGTMTPTTVSTAPFTDPNLPAGYAPYGITNLSGKLYVSYAVQDVARLNPVAAAGNGLIDVYDTNGTLVERFATGGALNAPRGLTLAPATFGDLSNDLLVANYGDGHINAYNATTGAYAGTLNYSTGAPVTVTGLSALVFGNGAVGDPTTLYFAGGAGVPGHGLFGTLRSNDLPLTATGQNLATHPGATFTGTVATFTDADPTGSGKTFTATINWGDGTPATAGVVTANSSGGFSVTGTHVYQGSGTFTTTVAISDTDTTHDTGGASATTTALAAVTDQPLTATNQTLLPSTAATFTGIVTTFTDADTVATAPGSYTATINWGDGTATSVGIITAINTPTNGTTNGTTGTTTTTTTTTNSNSTTTTTTNGTTTPATNSFTVSGTHTYASSGVYPVTVTIVDNDTSHDSGGATAIAASQAIVGGDEEHYIGRLYEDLLHRAPDPNGLAYFVAVLKATGSRQQVAQDIVNSTEYQTDVLNLLYERFLNRSIDPLGLLVWGTDLAHGVQIGTIESDILGSNEYLALLGNNNTIYVNALYQTVLNRAPNSSELQSLTQELTQGTRPSSIAFGVINSPEGTQDEVQLLYALFLHRPADQSGLSSYSAQLQSNDNLQAIIVSIVSSQEYHDMA